MATILVVDDEVGIRELLSEILADEGHTVRLAGNAQAAREWRQRERPDLVLLDIWMPDTDGVSLLKEWATAGQLSMPVVMMSGHASIDSAVEATRLGAFDFLEKPIALQKLLATVKRGLALPAERRAPVLTVEQFGRSSVMNDLRRRLQQLAQAKAWILLRGERGTIAEAYARGLVTAGAPFVNVTANLADLGDEVIQRASGGILFIDDLVLLGRIQLRGVAYAVSRAERLQVRLVAFASEDPARLATNGLIESAALSRIAESILPLPPLRRHAEDIPDIATVMCAQLVELRVIPDRRMSTAALNILRNYDWPRNLEQLQQVIRSAALSATDQEVTAADVERLLETLGAGAPSTNVSFDQPLREARDEFERAYFEYLIEKEGGSMSRVAEKSGMERTHLYRKLKQLGVVVGKSKD
jgi:two-component system, NtrC family, nitrogen regulation response regulator NtrX